MNIDPIIVGKLAAMGCSNCEIADLLGCSEGTIRSKRFYEILAKNRAEIRKNLRKAQIDAALAGNTAMMIWLGKQMLGQTDKSETEIRDQRGEPQQLIVVLEARKDGSLREVQDASEEPAQLNAGSSIGGVIDVQAEVK
ncbi:MAG TPA: hypothetical protein VMG59_12255 [Phycisphaerae bacterium]|nr:hypothetical protein [Phycisphaerae bacterium]